MSVETRTRDVTSKLLLALSKALAAEASNADSDWQSVTVPTLGEIEDLLDKAETSGYREFEVTEQAPNKFLVRWR